MRNQDSILLYAGLAIVAVILYKKYSTTVTAAPASQVNPAIPSGINSYDPGVIDRTIPVQTVSAPALSVVPPTLTFDTIQNM